MTDKENSISRKCLSLHTYDKRFAHILLRFIGQILVISSYGGVHPKWAGLRVCDSYANIYLNWEELILLCTRRQQEMYFINFDTTYELRICYYCDQNTNWTFQEVSRY